jgi:hypothetical protein
VTNEPPSETRLSTCNQQEMLPHPQSPPAVPSPALSYISTASCESSGYFNKSAEYMPSYENYTHLQTYQ